MSLSDIVVQLSGTAQAPRNGHHIEPNFQNYGTVMFDREMMAKGIRVGRLRTNPDGTPELDGFGQPVFDVYPSLDATLWIWMLPEVYHKQAWDAIEAVFPEFQGVKLDPACVTGFIAKLRRWIGDNVEPVG